MQVDAGGFREEPVEHQFASLSQQLDKLYTTIPDDTIVLGDANVPWPEGTAYVRAASELFHVLWGIHEIESISIVANTSEMDRADCHIQGGWFGGKAAAIDWWESETLRITALHAGLQR